MLFRSHTTKEWELILEDHVVGDEGLADDGVLVSCSEDESSGIPHDHVDILFVKHLIPLDITLVWLDGALFRNSILSKLPCDLLIVHFLEHHQRDSPLVFHKMVNQVDSGDGLIDSEPLAVTREEMRRIYAYQSLLPSVFRGMHDGAVQTLRPVIDAVVTLERVLVMTAFHRCEDDEESVSSHQ